MVAPGHAGGPDPNASMKETVSMHLNYRSIYTVYKLTMLNFTGNTDQIVYLDLTGDNKSFWDLDDQFY
jgi:hypothetical protein